MDGLGGFFSAFMAAKDAGKGRKSQGGDPSDAEIDANYARYKEEHGISPSPAGVAVYQNDAGEWVDSSGNPADPGTNPELTGEGGGGWGGQSQQQQGGWGGGRGFGR